MDNDENPDLVADEAQPIEEQSKQELSPKTLISGQIATTKDGVEENLEEEIAANSMDLQAADVVLSDNLEEEIAADSAEVQEAGLALSDRVSSEEVTLDIEPEKMAEEERKPKEELPSDEAVSADDKNALDIEAIKPEEDEVEDVSLSAFFKQYLPWFSITLVGLLLLLVAISLLASGTTQRQTYSLKDVNVPSFQGAVKMYSIGGEALKYTKQLTFIGNLQARELRKKIEPKLKAIYEAADLDVDAVLILAFVYGKGIDTDSDGSDEVASSNETSRKRRFGARIAGSSRPSLLIRHWVYLNGNVTKYDFPALLKKVKKAATDEPDVDIDIDSIVLIDLANITQVQAITVLSQHGFFKNGINSLDFELLATIGLVKGPSDIGLQSIDGGLCPGFKESSSIMLSPPICHDSSSTKLGMVCTFQCRSPLYLVGSYSRVCLSSGHWSGTPAMCKAKCPPIKVSMPGTLLPLACSSTNVSSGSLCFIQCPPTHQLFSEDDSMIVGSSFFMQCMDDGKWSGELAYCKAKCVSLDIPYNFNITMDSCASSSVAGDVCTLTCSDGYVVDGGGTSQQITCDSNGKWNKELLKCKKLCSAIIPFSNQIVEPSHCEIDPYEGLKCLFSCRQGYKLDSSIVRYCTSDGWEGIQPGCMASCTTLVPDRHGIFASNSGDCNENMPAAGTSCHLYCDAGFAPTSELILCDASFGNWTDVDVKCKRVCHKLPFISSSSWKPVLCNVEPVFGQCTLTCDIGYTLVGEGVLDCDIMTGKWNKKPGRCERTCAPLTPPTNGNLQPYYPCATTPTRRSRCEFSCNVGFVLSSRSDLICLYDGQWSRMPPTCNADEEYLIQTVYHDPPFCLALEFQYLYSSTEGAYNPVMLANCSNDRLPNRWSIVSSQFRSSLTGSCLSGSYKYLQLKDCDLDSVDSSDNAFVGGRQYQIIHNNSQDVFSFDLSSSLVQLSESSTLFSVTSSFKLINIATSVERSFYGLYSGSCAPLVNSSNMQIPTDCLSVKASSTWCTISCDSGYQLLNGDTSIRVTCADGVWNLTAQVKCVASDGCTRYPEELLLNGVSSSCNEDKIAKGKTCLFSCDDEDYYIDGPSIVYCSQESRWSVYSVVTCRRPCLLEDGYRTMITSLRSSSCLQRSNIERDLCQYKCPDANDILEGHPVTSCRDPYFSIPAPICLQRCRPFDQDTVLLEARCATIETTLETELGSIPCSLDCAPGYALPNFPLTCDGGKWSIPEGCTPSCPAIKSPPGAFVLPSSCSTTSSVIGTTCEISCEYNNTFLLLGGSLVQNMQRTCNSDRLWDNAFSYCSQFCPPLSSSLAGSGGYFWPDSCVGRPQRPGFVCHLKCLGLSSIYGGENMLQCTMEGRWEIFSGTQQLGSCLHPCGSLYQPPFSVVSPHHCKEGPVDPGTECVIECPPNMERQGPGAFICLGATSSTSATSSWSSNERSRCMAKCPPLPMLSNTRIFPQSCVDYYTLEGDYCSFECERGLSLSSTSALQCMENGEWSEEVPVCQRTCIGVQVFNGHMSCAGLPFDASVGFNLFPGTKCTFICDEGYTALYHNEVTCTQQGIWSPNPYCKRQEESFTIFQKIKEESKCLSVTWNSANIGSNWLLSFISSAEGCIAAGNNARWHWHGLNNLKHVQSGLCIAAERAKRESLLVLELCDIDNPLQQWDCDSWRSSRVLLKGTDLSIDTTYEGLGPVLETWTHALAYWLTFNEELETTASLCSFRPVATCPGISIPNVVVSPDACSGDDVLVWQKCELSCTADSYSTYPLLSTECLPTGEWKDIEEVRCVKKCPSLPGVAGKRYTPESCGTGDMDHHSQCSVSCKDGFRLSNNESSVTLLCDDGKWDGPSAECVCAPMPPENGAVACINETCTIICNPGFKLSSNSPKQISCPFDTSSTVVCTEDQQFMICSEQVSGTFSSDLCLTVANNDLASSEISKMEINLQTLALYWRWSDNKLQHIVTGKCLSSSSNNDWNKLMTANCDVSGVLAFDCNNHLNPRVIRVSSSNIYIGFGGIALDAPAVFVNETSSRMVEWFGISHRNTRGTICAFKNKGQCPKLDVNEYTAIDPSSCEEESTVGTSCGITCTGSGRFLNTVSSEFSSDTSTSLTCNSQGAWTSARFNAMISVMPCVLASGSCPSFIVNNRLIVEPPKCMSGDTMTTGFRCSFTCHSSFYMVGQAVTYCRSDSTWTSSMPTCERYCPLLSGHKHTTASPPKCLGATSRRGTACVLTCVDGYTTSPPLMSVTTECLDDGTWSDVTIVCKKTCPLLSSTEFGATADNNTITGGTMKVLTSSACALSVQVEGNICLFSCPPSYVLVDGGSQSTCNYGVWSGKIGRCIAEFFCPRVTLTGTESVVYDGKYAGEAVAAGTAVYITCMEGYVVDGDNERLCEESGSWGGRGPATPACLRMCPPLPKKFRTLIAPPECTSGYSANGVLCTATCQSNTAYSDTSLSFSITCSNGVWSDNLKTCMYAEEDTRSDCFYREFMIVTRNPEPGCLYPDDGDVVKWKSMLECNAADQINKWAWTDQRAIINLESSKCLQAVKVNNDAGILGVAHCDGSSRQIFSCGNPKSAMEWSMFYFGGNTIWEMAYTTNENTGRIVSIDMKKVSSNFQRFNKHNFAALQLFATEDIVKVSSRDWSICSYMCGEKLSSEPTNGYISSPGFLKGLQYPPYSSCKWTIVAYHKLIQLSLLELDLEGTAISASPCKKDCVQVYEGEDSNPSSSDHLMTYSGSNLDIYRHQGKQEISSVSGAMFIHFMSDRQTNGKGFVFKYIIKDIPAPSDCGVSLEQWAVPPEDDEPPLGGRPHISKWPWLVSIRHRAERKGRAYHRCTGVLVDATTVISAAHCANFAITALTMDQGVTIGVGQTSQFTMDDDLAIGRITEAHRVFIHPDYNPETRTNDIAVWKLRSSPSYNGSEMSVCVPTAGYAMHHTASPCYAIGWTKLDNGISVRRIVEYRMRLEPTSFCELMFGLQANSGFICAVLDRLDNTVAAGTDDSEPLICFSDIDKWYVVGVASHTRVSRYMTRRLYTSVHANAAWLRLTIDRTAIVSPRSRGLELLDQALLDLMEADSSGERQEGESGSGEEL